MQTLTTTAGQIGLLPAAGFGAAVIRGITAGPFAHVINDLGDGTCIGAQPGGARIRPISEFKDVVWSHFDFTPEQAADGVQWLRRQEGTPYNFLDDLFIGIAILQKQNTANWITERLSDNGSWQCAQLADAHLTRLGIHVFQDERPFGAVFPNSYVDFFEQKCWMPREKDSVGV